MIVITDKEDFIKYCFKGTLEFPFRKILETDKIYKDVPFYFYDNLNFRFNNLKMYDTLYNLRNIQDLVDEGLVFLQDYEKIENDKIVELTEEEQAIKGLIPLENYLPKLKLKKEEEITNNFDLEMGMGHFVSSALGIEVDCRRSDKKNDKQNVEGLISNMTRKSKTTVNYVGYSEIKQNVTINDLQILVAEMEDHVLGLYEKKWIKQDEINNASTVEEVININW